MRKKILVACEYSGAFTNALLEKGFDAVSCDLLDTDGSLNHIKADVLDIIDKEKWLAVIGFPPCDFLSKAGLFRCDIEKYGFQAVERIQKRNDAVNFFLKLWMVDAPFVLLENPIGFISSTILKPTQIVSPHFFGDNYRKDTCLWLKGFPKINYVLEENLFSQKTKKDLHIEKYDSGINKVWTDGKSKKERSRMSKLMAQSIVDQITPHLISLMDLPKLSGQPKI